MYGALRSCSERSWANFEMHLKVKYHNKLSTTFFLSKCSHRTQISTSMVS